MDWILSFIGAPSWLTWIVGALGTTTVLALIAVAVLMPGAFSIAAEYLRGPARVLGDISAHLLNGFWTQWKALTIPVLVYMILPAMFIGGFLFDDGVPKVSLKKRPEISRSVSTKNPEPKKPSAKAHETSSKDKETRCMLPPGLDAFC